MPNNLQPCARRGNITQHCFLLFHLLVIIQLPSIAGYSSDSSSPDHFQDITSPPPLYQACAPLQYGHHCQNRCTCPRNQQDCNDGPSGDGSCTCPYGSWNVTCFLESSPLIPEDEGGQRNWIPGFRQEEQRQLTALSVEDIPSSKRVRKVRTNLVHVLPTPFKGTSMLLALHLDAAEKIGWMSNLSSLENIHSVCDYLEHDRSKTNNSSSIEKGEQLATEIAQILSGSTFLPGSTPYAHAYGGHQFGSWSGQLGDGRAITLGEKCSTLLDNTSNTTTCQEISIKGGGKTMFSRAGDGRATLQLSIREYLASVALPAIGIPSVQSLALVASAKGNEIIRDEWYSGYAKKVPSGILVRVAPSLVRLGGLQLAALQNDDGHKSLVRYARWVLRLIYEMELVDDESSAYVRNALDIGLYDEQQSNSTILQECFFCARKSEEASCASKWETMQDLEALECLLSRTSERLAALVASWNAAGFTHGVLNTDNVSPLGLTIDLNVFGFMERFDEHFVSNGIDGEGRYAFGKQKDIMEWNLWRLADVLMGKGVFATKNGDGNETLDWMKRDVAERVIRDFDRVYDQCRLARFKLRLGLQIEEAGDDVAERKSTSSADGSEFLKVNVSSTTIVDSWIQWLRASKADYHRASRALAEVSDDIFDTGEISLERAATIINSWSGGDKKYVPLLKLWLVNFRLRLQRARSIRNQKEVISTTIKEGDGVDSESRSCTSNSLLNEEVGLRSVDEKDDQFAKAWGEQIRAVAPYYILRTSFSKDITSRIVEGLQNSEGIQKSSDEPKGIAHARMVLSKATRVLKDPFETEKIDLSQAQTSKGSSDPSISHQSQLIGKWLRDHFSALSPPSHMIDRRDVQTSCGGQ